MKIDQLITQQLMITLYGELLEGISIDKASALPSGFSKGAYFCQIRGISTASHCLALPSPVLLILPTAGQELTEPECGWEKPNRKWMLDPTFRTVSLALTPGSISNLVLPDQQRGINTSGGVSFDNWKFEDGKVCATAHIWAKVESCVDVWPIGPQCVTLLDARYDQAFCVAIGTCYDFLKVGPVTGTVCYRPPKTVCVKLTADLGVWSGTIFEQCVEIPIATV